MTAKHPDTVLQVLLDAPDNARRQDRLKALHALCSELHAKGHTDFSAPGVAEGCQERKILNPRGLHNSNAASYRALLAAWSAYADDQVLDAPGEMPVNHPDGVLRRLLASDARADRKRGLRAVHELCRKHHASGSIDFSPTTIGKLCHAQGLLGERSLFNPDFAQFRTLLDAWADFARPWLQHAGVAAASDKLPQRQHDVELQWVARDYPELEAWRQLAVDWLKGEKAGLNHKIFALRCFFEDYLLRQKLPLTPEAFFARGTTLPDFRATACPTSNTGETYNNAVHAFLTWVLARDFSAVADDGTRVVLPAFRNPVPLLTRHGVGLDESVRSPLPYGYIDELRQMLAQGPHFQDWTFAQNALGVAVGEQGAPGRDWFDVTEDLVDRNDPDCVVRVRQRRGRNVLQMWSPVRWVALLVKLLLPLRTTQVRLLDSGEADTWRYDNGAWSLNKGPLASGSVRQPLQQGVLRRAPDPVDASKVSTVLYINTNKTADIGKDGPAKGYVMPWHAAANSHQNVFYWLEKLRNWQQKYNPVLHRTSWSALDARHIAVKSDHQLASYPDACFLFRMAEGLPKERSLPVSDGVIDNAWCNLLAGLEARLAARGEAHADGSAIRLVEHGPAGQLRSHFPLHSLRVSLVTALALDGEVPFPILQKLVGHSRLLMTLYYTKPGTERVNSVLQEASERLEEGKERSIHEFLLNTEHDRLVESAIANSASSLATAIPVHPAARNPAGWMAMHHGLCLVGGNTSELEDNGRVGGCYNGGPNLGTETTPKFAPVPGGSRNCVRCRWFVTEPHYLPALVAQFNTLAYHFDEARNRSLAAEEALQTVKRRKASTEAQDGTFADHKELRQAERLWETSLKRFSDLAEDLAACWRLIERAKVALEAAPAGGTQVLVRGAGEELRVAIEETASELLQLSGVCRSLEAYPDLEADKAVIRRSQLLDSALYNDGLPPVFMQLSEREQLLTGNAFMRRLALQADPSNPLLGERRVIELIDAGKALSEQLGIELAGALSQPRASLSLSVIHRPPLSQTDEIDD